MENKFEFTLTVPQSWLYSPADLIKKYAKENAGVRFFYDLDWRAILIINGTKYKYERWKIKKNNDGTETVTVYLVAK